MLCTALVKKARPYNSVLSFDWFIFSFPGQTKVYAELGESEVRGVVLEPKHVESQTGRGTATRSQRTAGQSALRSEEEESETRKLKVWLQMEFLSKVFFWDHQLFIRTWYSIVTLFQSFTSNFAGILSFSTCATPWNMLWRSNRTFVLWRHLTSTTRMHFAAIFVMQMCVTHERF